ncbi:MAG: hypothetical protein KAW12_00750 [Candidatus Aminicenantes bacterium]|nr:hypothetical protein [Candidatus Aminicenantes bacterium]
MNTAIPSTANNRETGLRLFIKKFKTAGQHYIYDVRSNEIIKVSPVIWDIIDHVDKPVNSIAAKLKLIFAVAT